MAVIYRQKVAGTYRKVTISLHREVRRKFADLFSKLLGLLPQPLSSDLASGYWEQSVPLIDYEIKQGGAVLEDLSVTLKLLSSAMNTVAAEKALPDMRRILTERTTFEKEIPVGLQSDWALGSLGQSYANLLLAVYRPDLAGDVKIKLGSDIAALIALKPPQAPRSGPYIFRVEVSPVMIILSWNSQLPAMI